MSFPFENLEVYRQSLAFVEQVEVLNQNLKGKATFSLMDQMSRAALSIPLNISEGQGRWRPPFYQDAPERFKGGPP